MQCHIFSGTNRRLAAAALAGVGAALLVAPVSPASAAAVGDDFATPRIIARATGVDDLTDTTFFTAEAGEPKHASSVATRSAWFKWQSPATGRVTFRTQGTDFDTVMSAYTGSSLSTLTSVGESDDAPFNDGSIRQSQLQFTATAGVTYRIAVDGFSSGNLGQVRLSWDANDSFSGATPLSGPGAGQTEVANTDNTGATKEPGEPAHAGSSGGHSVWFSWKAPASGKAAFSVGRGDLPDSLLAAYKGSSVNALTQVAANDDAEPGLGVSAISFAAVKGTTYHIAVDGKRSDDPLGTVSPDQGRVLIGYTLTPAAVPTMSINDVSLTEGDSGLKQANLVVTLSKAAATDVTVTALTLEGDAKQTTDYVSRNASVLIPKGSTSAGFPVQIVGDIVAEPKESFSVCLTSATGGITISDSCGSVTVVDNDAPKLSVLDAAVTEGNSGTKSVTVTVKASKASTAPMTVRLGTVSDTAKSGTDFTAVSSREIVLAAGASSRTTTVPVVGDLIGENLETFEVVLTSPTGGALVDDGTGVVTITDNDPI